jgi:putative endonuclease
VKKSKLEIGKDGEHAAALFLQSKGYIILARNYRFRKAEVDIIAEHEGHLIFIEVRSKKNAAFGFPEQTISSKKEELYLQAAEHYMEKNPSALKLRFDLISIINNTSGIEIKHFEDVDFEGEETHCG